MNLFAWGANSYGQLGLGYCNEQQEIPHKVEIDVDVQLLKGGGGHSVLLTDNGKVLATGWNGRGQLGLAHKQNVFNFTPIPLEINAKVTNIVCGWDFTFIIDENYRVWGCGSNSFGQLGMGDQVRGCDVFTRIPGLQDNIVHIACGLRHSLFLTKEGQVFGCGTSKRGQLGLEEQEIHFDITPIQLPEPISSINAGQHFSLALSKNGTLYGFGENKHGEVMSQNSYVHKIVLNGLSAPIEMISCGWSHVLAVLEDKTLIMWGRNDKNQLGSSVSNGPPYNIMAVKALNVQAGSEHCIAQRLCDGKLVSWGWNEHGNCGVGTVDNIKEPQIIKIPIDYKKVLKYCAASGHNFAVVD